MLQGTKGVAPQPGRPKGSGQCSRTLGFELSKLAPNQGNSDPGLRRPCMVTESTPQSRLGPSPHVGLGPELTSDPDTLCALLHARPTSLWVTPGP